MVSDYKALAPALDQQNWTVEPTSNGHVKAYPPDKGRPIVCYSPSSRNARSFKNTVARLRKSGFVWPWPPELSAPDEEPDEEPEDEEEEVAEEATVTELPAANPDKLFNELKEARTYAALAKDALNESKHNFEEAEKALRGSEEEYERAVEQMNLCKRRFDKAFEAEEL